MRRVGGLAVALAFLAAGCLGGAPGPAPPTILVYGDSFANESAAVIIQQLSATNPGYRIVVRDYPGTAMCDWFSDMNDPGATAGVQKVALVFAGAYSTPCVRNVGDYLKAWFLDVHYAADVWHNRGIPVYMIGLPGQINTGPTDGTPPRTVAMIEQGTAAGYASGVHYVEAGTNFLTGSVYTKFQPCGPLEGPGVGCSGGQIQVRNDDGLHLCLQSNLGPGVSCPAYAGGVMRLAQAMAAAF